MAPNHVPLWILQGNRGWWQEPLIELTTMNSVADWFLRPFSFPSIQMILSNRLPFPGTHGTPIDLTDSYVNH